MLRPQSLRDREPPIPSDRSVDSTLAFLRKGYSFVSNRCERLGSDVFSTRIMLRNAVCMRGAAAAELFYGSDHFTRAGAMPVTVLKLLQDRGSVQLMEGEPHRHRKLMFMSLMIPDAIGRLSQLTESEWLRRLPSWERAPQVILFDELRAILTRAVCAWAGVPLREADAERRTWELSEMIESTGSVGPRNWRALMLRVRSEGWVRGIVRRVRAGDLPAPENSALRAIASHLDHEGRQLDVKVAGVELLNVLRPTVAVARFMVFAALALHERPELRERIVEGGEAYLDAFVQEVRRHSPFFLIIGGRVKTPFDWRGHRLAKGAWVLLDLFGTNHDPRSWEAPEVFRPERFLEKQPTAFDLVPQGGGEHLQSHRCPGEWITIELTKLTVQMLVTRLKYGVPAQDLSVNLARIPALPKSGFVMCNVAQVDQNAGDAARA